MLYTLGVDYGDMKITMKKLFTLLLCVPMIAGAHKREIGVGGGVSVNSIPGGLYYTIQSKEQRLLLNGSFYGKMLWERGRQWQAGVNLGFTRWAVGHTLFGNAGAEASYKMIYGNPAVNISFEADRKINFGASSLYFGMNLGAIVMWSHGDGGDLNLYTPAPFASTYVPEKQYLNEAGYGVVLGLQLGYTYYFGRIGLNAEVSPRVAYVVMPDNWYPNLSMIYCPGTVGLRLKL